MKTCPSCRRPDWVAEIEPVGILERGPMRWFQLRPFLCLQCETRFHRFQLGSDSSRQRPPHDLEGSFLKSNENLEFHELVEQLREAEQRIEEDRVGPDVDDRNFKEVG